MNDESGNELSNEFSIDLANLIYSKIKNNKLMNKILLTILLESKQHNTQVTQKVLLERFNLSKYKLSKLVSYLEGAQLINPNNNGYTCSYEISTAGEYYIRNLAETKEGKEMIKEMNHE